MFSGVRVEVVAGVHPVTCFIFIMIQGGVAQPAVFQLHHFAANTLYIRVSNLSFRAALYLLAHGVRPVPLLYRITLRMRVTPLTYIRF